MPGWTCHSRAPSSPYVTDLLLVTQDADAGGWSWRRLGGPEVSTEIEHGDAQALAPRAHSSRVLAVVPGAQVGWHPVALPLKGARLLAAAPYALEDALAEDVEKLHVALAGPEQAAAVYVCRRSWIEEQLATFDTLEPQELIAVVPEQALLPAAIERPVLAALPDRWLLSLPGGRRLVTPVGGLPGLEALLAHPEGIDFISIGGAPAPEGLTLARREDLPHLLALAGLDASRRGNLLQGAYRRESARHEWLQRLRWPAALAASFLLLHSLLLGWAVYNTGQQAEAARGAAEAAFRETFPQITRIVDMRVQASQELAAARGGGSDAALLQLLNASAQALASTKGLRLEGLQYRDAALYLSLGGDNLQALETLRNDFAEQPRWRLEVQSANAGADGVQIRLKLEAA